MIFPLVYLIYIIVRGAVTGFYPYFFVDVKTFGFGQVAINAFVLLLVFALFSSLFIFIGKKLTRKNIS
ncbi:MAG: hypothetical protein EOP43_06360 [Sphingobacteriaceae bacterium]|nr:MAG: hypothetical protein EOP43_06360 [Sphingobacteriaceae bacterium]